MDFKEIKRESNEATIEYKIDFEDFVPFLDKAYKKDKNRFTIPGFRKGKAPRTLIERHYGEDIFYDEALNMMIPELYDRSIEELELTPVAQPYFSMESLDKEEGIVLNAVVALLPEVTLGEYKNLKVELMEVEVTEEEVEAKLKEEQEKNARLVPADLTEDGSDIIMDFVGSIDGVEFDGGSAEDADLTLGSGHFIPGFEDQLIGKGLGEVDVNVTFPEDYSEESLAGKDAHFAVVIKDIKNKELPEIDDDFIGDISEFDTVEEFKADLREKLEKEKEEFSLAKKAEDALVAAIENMEVELPKAMVEDGVDRKVYEMDQQLSQQGFSLAQFIEMTGGKMEEFRSQYVPQVELEIKRELLLDAIIEAEGLEVSQEEIDEMVKEQAEEFKMEEEEIRKIYERDNYEYLKQGMLYDKAQALIVDSVEVI
ncbi:MAG: trigger factor [Tissierellia bacterium]|nr:trigger factor [Tissierellia bacterium]